MKLSKYLAGCILMIALTLLLTIVNINALPSSIPNGFLVSCEGVADIDFAAWNAAAKRHHVGFCAVSDHETAIQQRECTFYVDEYQREYIWKDCLGTRTGTYADILGNQRTLLAEPFSKLLRDRDLQNSIRCCLLFGNAADCRAWINELGGQGWNLNLQEPQTDTAALFPFLVFGIILLLLLFYCYLDASFEKKEIAIRVLHGDSPLYHYMQFCLSDTVVFGSMIAAAFFLQDAVSPLIRFYQRVWLLGIPFLIAIWLVNLQLLFIRPKEMLYGHQLSGKLMVMLHGLGSISAVVTSAVMLSASADIPALQKYRKANDFFAAHSDYEFVDLQYGDELWMQLIRNPEIKQDANRVMREFYRKTDAVLEPVSMARLTRNLADYSDPPDIELIYCNFRALPYVQSVCPEAAQCDLQKYDAALLIPETATEDEIAFAGNFLKDQYQNIECRDLNPDALQQILYTSWEEMISFEESADSRFVFCKKPFVILTADPEGDPEQNRNLNFLSAGSIYRHTDAQKLRPYLEDMPVRFVRTNVFTQFQKEYDTHKKLVKTALYLSIMILCLYMFILHTVMVLDYKVNAVELSVKKVLGWSIPQKNKKHFVIASFIFVLNFAAAILYVLYSQILSGALLLTVPAVLYIGNLALLCGLIQRIERKSLIKILKGGAL